MADTEELPTTKLMVLCPAWCNQPGRHRIHRSESICGTAGDALDGQIDAWIEQRPGQADPVLRVRVGSAPSAITSLAAGKFIAHLLDVLIGDHWAVVRQRAAAS